MLLWVNETIITKMKRLRLTERIIISMGDDVHIDLVLPPVCSAKQAPNEQASTEHLAGGFQGVHRARSHNMRRSHVRLPSTGFMRRAPGAGYLLLGMVIGTAYGVAVSAMWRYTSIKRSNKLADIISLSEAEGGTDDQTQANTLKITREN